MQTIISLHITQFISFYITVKTLRTCLKLYKCVQEHAVQKI